MVPQNLKEIDWSYKGPIGINAEKEVYVKYGKEYLVSDYVNEYKDGTNAKEIISKAGGLQNLPHAMEKIKNSEISIDMSEDLFTINRKLKLGAIAQRKYEAEQAALKELEKAAEAEAAATNKEAE